MNRNDITIEIIKKIRKEKNLTLERMAEKINKSKSAYDRLEKGQVELTLNETEEIAEKLGSDFNTLTNAGVVYHNEKNTVFDQGSNPTINIKLDETQMAELMDALKK